MIEKNSIAGMTPDNISAALLAAAIDDKYAQRIAYWIYKKRITSIDKMLSISGEVRQRLKDIFNTGLTPPSFRTESEDRSVKYLFTYSGGRTVETVFIPEAKRKTVCVSTQCGCARACAYCRTGAMGLKGNLTAGEIVNQILSIAEGESVTHVVFMGMGEPLDNTEQVVRAIEILSAEWGLAISGSNITVSTVGIIPGIIQLLNTTRCNLTLSLVSPLASERIRLVPAERAYPAQEVIRLMKDAPPLKKRRFTVAYMLLEGINDTEEHLEALTDILKDSTIRVNLLRYHNHGGLPFRPSADSKLNYFRDSLYRAGISASVRRSRGEDIFAACGMLGNPE
jgi:23S rRNA (adenine2503-C2)-methyltransferase